MSVSLGLFVIANGVGCSSSQNEGEAATSLGGTQVVPTAESTPGVRICQPVPITPHENFDSLQLGQPNVIRIPDDDAAIPTAWLMDGIIGIPGEVGSDRCTSPLWVVGTTDSALPSLETPLPVLEGENGQKFVVFVNTGEESITQFTAHYERLEAEITDGVIFDHGRFNRPTGRYLTHSAEFVDEPGVESGAFTLEVLNAEDVSVPHLLSVQLELTGGSFIIYHWRVDPPN